MIGTMREDILKLDWLIGDWQLKLDSEEPVVEI
jgi:hypothetical protein